MRKEVKLKLRDIKTQLALLYGGESWILRESDKNRIEAAEMRFLTPFLGLTFRDRIRSEDIRELEIKHTMVEKNNLCNVDNICGKSSLRRRRSNPGPWFYVLSALTTDLHRIQSTAPDRSHSTECAPSIMAVDTRHTSQHICLTWSQATKGNTEGGRLDPVLWIGYGIAQWSERLLHTDWSLVLPCGNTEMSFINAPSTHEDTYHHNICLGNGEHRIECTDPKESSLHVWRELCDPSCLTYKEKPEIVAKAPKMRFYRKRCDEACPNYKAKSESVEKRGKRRKNRLWRETCIETCPNYKAKTTKRGEKRKHSALKEEVMDIEAIVQQLSV
ncbi:hypothetical protein ANN_12887 [Periplaneta americana]|uniref:Uncharacterized protein n=1 Tax=Periplaneta americana TaxID=6978 RepID=A0ABQ8TK07_PERAM|nr:hypothetical protein ANN_12887 [Periplaneta americana]